jgi:hypothetical protein
MSARTLHYGDRIAATAAAVGVAAAVAAAVVESIFSFGVAVPVVMFGGGE